MYNYQNYTHLKVFYLCIFDDFCWKKIIKIFNKIQMQLKFIALMNNGLG